MESFKNSEEKLVNDPNPPINAPHDLHKSLEANAKQIVPLLSNDSFSYVASDKLNEDSIQKEPAVLNQKSNSLSRGSSLNLTPEKEHQEAHHSLLKADPEPMPLSMAVHMQLNDLFDEVISEYGEEVAPKEHLQRNDLTPEVK